MGYSMIKKQITLLIFLSLGFNSQWIEISSDLPSKPDVQLISSDIDNTTLSFSLSGFYLHDIVVDGNEYVKTSFPGGASLLEAGNPDLSKYSASIIIPDDKHTTINIVSSNYVEYNDINVIPSKGNISRLFNPDDIDYTFSGLYKNDAFYPETIAELNTPYILRDFRGQVVEFHPFQFNPITKVLRVYTDITIEVSSDSGDAINPFNRQEDIERIDNEYKNIYNHQFINFNNDLRFDYLVDHGNMLIISYGDFIDEMQPLVDWKNLKGIPTEIVSVSDIGSNTTSITNFVADYYNSAGLTFLLLVGDVAQIPSPSVSGSASDMSYGCISGSDYYPEVIVGRISGSTPNHISTQVERSIEYERYPQSNVEWYDNALGIASNQGPGFNGYTDDDFNDFLWNTVLSDFTYDSYQGIYDPNGSDSQGITAINNGVSLINYTGHGSISSWGNGSSLNTSQINQLTNNNKLPFVITVGCNVGEFNSTSECFSESWLRATNNGEPTGAIAHFGSTISQSWEPPMHGQYGMNLIITESYDENLTRSLGGITANGCMYMNDAQGSAGINETKYWTFFGDPSTNIRTAPATAMTIIHDDVILVGAEEFVVDVGEEGALAALSRNGELIASSYSVGGVAVLSLGDAASIPGTLDLVVTGFNSIPHEGEVMVIAPEGAYVVIDDIEVQYGLVEDGYLLYGSENNLSLNISNIGSDAANNLNVMLTADSEYVTILENSVNYSNIAPNQSVSIDGLAIQPDWNTPDGEVVNLTFMISSDDAYWESNVSLAVQAPMIDLNGVSGSLNPGEMTDLVISLSNNGSAPINYPMVSAEGDMYVSINSAGINNAYYWDYLQVSNQEDLNVNVTVSASAPIGHVAELTVYVNNLNGGLDISFPVYVTVGQVTEGFEAGFNGMIDWEFSGNESWGVTTDDQYAGFYSAKSGNIGDNQTSEMSTTLEVIADGTIEFFYRVASEYSPSGQNFYDGLQFYIDDQMIGQYQPTVDGDTPWVYVSNFVSAGVHTFKWVYIKDGGGGATDMDEDCAWVDAIVFPPSYLGDDSIVGDINGDGTVSVLDIIQVVNIIVGASEFNMAGDVNSDGSVDVLDVITVVNIILEV